MLAGNGFTNIYNLSGGIKAWEQEIAFGPEDQGMDLFSGKETVEEYIKVAFGLEEGLRDFYLSMTEQAQEQESRALFSKLAEIEILHQDKLLLLYNEVTGSQVSREYLLQNVATSTLEGGLTTEEYLSRFNPDLSSITDVLSLAMSIEAQALDLYQRASFQAENDIASETLQQIANDERVHIQHLADYMDKQLG